ncbi:MAG: hypothetical protein FJ403_10275 [Verrucomicrobia bacterium]|nr:hypothetical protein [Verrucomicrobiota bacterium]
MPANQSPALAGARGSTTQASGGYVRHPVGSTALEASERGVLATLIEGPNGDLPPTIARLLDELTALRSQPSSAAVIAQGIIRSLERVATNGNGNGQSGEWSALVEDGADIMAEDLPTVVELVEGIVAEQCKLVIGSGSKSFKTWLTIDLWGVGMGYGSFPGEVGDCPRPLLRLRKSSTRNFV